MREVSSFNPDEEFDKKVQKKKKTGGAAAAFLAAWTAVTGAGGVEAPKGQDGSSLAGDNVENIYTNKPNHPGRGARRREKFEDDIEPEM